MPQAVHVLQREGCNVQLRYRTMRRTLMRLCDPFCIWMQCLNEEVLQPMVSCIRKMPRLMSAEALAHLWPTKAPAATDLAGSIIANSTLNVCRCCLLPQHSKWLNLPYHLMLLL